MPRLEIIPHDLPFHADPHQREVAAVILMHIRSGSCFAFRYLGGSSPGLIRFALPIWLFQLDYRAHD